MKTILIALSLAALLCGCSTNQPITMVVPGLYRGAQPADGDWPGLKDHIFREIRMDTEAEHSSWAAATNWIQVIALPIPLWRQLTIGPNKKLMTASMKLVTTGTLVNCVHGVDRTSVWFYQYEVQVLGWPKKMAWEDLRAHGFHWELIGLYVYAKFRI